MTTNMITEFSYIHIPVLSGDSKADVESILLANGKVHVFNHVVNVAQKSIELARLYHLDETVCEIAAYCHDIATIIKPSDMMQYFVNTGAYIDEAEIKYPFLLHQRASALLANQLFHIEDQRILDAICCHTTLKCKPTEHDMALFIADKLAWDQAGMPPFYDEVNHALGRSLSHASLCYIQFVLKNGMILHPHKWLLEAQEWLLKHCER